MSFVCNILAQSHSAVLPLCGDGASSLRGDGVSSLRGDGASGFRGGEEDAKGTQVEEDRERGF